jgi:hypothetical protein
MLMAINLTTAEQKELAEQTKRDPTVIMSFYEWYDRFRQWVPDDATACQFALRKQEKVFREVYENRAVWYAKAVRKDYRARLMNLKRLLSGSRFKKKSGIQVRSKAEKIIADFLFEKGIRFVYQPIVDLDGYYVIPDFHLGGRLKGDATCHVAGAQPARRPRRSPSCWQSHLRRWSPFPLCPEPPQQTPAVDR